MKQLILILTLTVTSAFAEFSAFDFSSPQGQEHLETAQRADKWANEYLKNFLDTIGPLKANGMAAMLTGAVVTAQDNLEKVARHLTDDPDSQAQFVEEATSSLKLYAKELEGIFLAYPNSPKEGFKKAKEYLNEE